MQETEETAIILDLEEEEQTDENDLSVTESGKKVKTRAEAKRLVQEDSLGEEHPRTIKQFLKSVLLLPVEIVCIVVSSVCLFLTFVLFGAPEESET